MSTLRHDQDVHRLDRNRSVGSQGRFCTASLAPRTQDCSERRPAWRIVADAAGSQLPARSVEAGSGRGTRSQNQGKLVEEDQATTRLYADQQSELRGAPDPLLRLRPAPAVSALVGSVCGSEQITSSGSGNARNCRATTVATGPNSPAYGCTQAAKTVLSWLQAHMDRQSPCSNLRSVSAERLSSPFSWLATLTWRQLPRLC